MDALSSDSGTNLGNDGIRKDGIHSKQRTIYQVQRGNNLENEVRFGSIEDDECSLDSTVENSTGSGSVSSSSAISRSSDPTDKQPYFQDNVSTDSGMMTVVDDNQDPIHETTSNVPSTHQNYSHAPHNSYHGNVTLKEATKDFVLSFKSESTANPSSNAGAAAATSLHFEPGAVLSKYASPNPSDLPPRPRRRTVSFLEDHGIEHSVDETDSTGDAAEEGHPDEDAASQRSVEGSCDAASAVSSKPKIFRVAYLGNSILDRRYPSDFQPWVMAEIRRIGTTTPVVLSSVSAATTTLHTDYRAPTENGHEPIFLRAVSEMDSSVLFEHDMSTISRFVRLHNDRLCFAFMTKNAQNVDKPYTCYVFLGYNEEVVPALFNLVRRCAVLSSAKGGGQAEMRLRSGSYSKEGDLPVGDGSLPSRPPLYDNFEVQLVGRLRVSGHKGPDTLIDDCITKLDRRRLKRLHSQDGVTRLSPETDDGGQTDRQSSHADATSRRRRSGAVHSSNQPQPSAVCPQATTNQKQPINGQSPEAKVVTEEDGSHNQASKPYQYPCAVIFQVGVKDIVIRDPTTATYESKNYEQISKCQTGIISVVHFGFIWRETVVDPESESQALKRDYYVYVFKGASECVVNEVMLKLHQAFSALHAQRTQARAVNCELCPLHQLHKLCREIEGLEAERAISILVQRIEAQDEDDVEVIVGRYKQESPRANDPQDHLEVLMSVLRHVCQQKQQHHIHIAERRDGSSSPVQSRARENRDFILDAQVRRVSTADKVSHFFKRTAKKSLLASFEHLVKGEADDDGGIGLGGRRSSIQTLHTMTDGFFPFPSSEDVNSSSASHKSPAKKTPTFYLDDRPPNSPTLKTNPEPGSSPKVRPRSKTLGQLPTIRRMKESFKTDSQQLQEVPPLHAQATLVQNQDTVGQAQRLKEKETEMEFILSPKKKMFSRIGNPGSGLGSEDEVPSSLLDPENSNRRSSVASVETESSVFLEDSPPASQFRRNKSWRQSLYRNVVTPGSEAGSRRGSHDVTPLRAGGHVRSGASGTSGDTPSSSRRPSAHVDALTWVTSPTSPLASHRQEGCKRTSAELRDLWRSAITQQILLNKMEKQNSQLAVSLDKAVLKREKLVYEELTPCLKQVSLEWDNALQLCSSSPPPSLPHAQLRDLVRRGIPRAKRGAIWKLLMQQEASLPFVARARSASSSSGSVDVARPFNELLKLLTIHQHAILIDLSRTFPTHPYFAKQLGQGQLSLFNLLKAYSLIDTNVGYCQGLSFVAGILLMHLEEEDAFEAMKYLLVTSGLRLQYCPEMTALQVQMYQLSRLIHDHHPSLSKKLDSFEMSPTLFAASWFLTIFASQFPLGFVARVFDLVFLEGIQAIFKVSVALLGQHLPLLLECDSFESLVEFLKSTLPALSSVQMERVMAEAFELEEDISKNLSAYQIEYHIFQDELAITPGGSTGHTLLSTRVGGENASEGSDSDVLDQLDKANRKLKQQNFTLLEQLQAAQATLDHYATTVKQLKGKVADLEKQLESEKTTKEQNGNEEGDQGTIVNGVGTEIDLDNRGVLNRNALVDEELKLFYNNNNLQENDH